MDSDSDVVPPIPGERDMHVAASKVEHQHREELFVHLGLSDNTSEITGWSKGPVGFPHAFFSTCSVFCCDVSGSLCFFRCMEPNRQVWPAPNIVSMSRRVGAKRVRFGKCNSVSVPGSGWWRITTNVVVRDWTKTIIRRQMDAG